LFYELDLSEANIGMHVLHALVVGLIGLASTWRGMRRRRHVRFWIGLWGGFQILMLVYLYSTYGYMTGGMFCLLWLHCVYLFRRIGGLARHLRGTSAAESNPCGAGRMAWILLGVGMAINLPKLASPLRIDKSGYRQASQWVAEHTPEGTWVLTDDARAGFYANRPSVRISQQTISTRYRVAVCDRAKIPRLPAFERKHAEMVCSTTMNSRNDEQVVGAVVEIPKRKARPVTAPGVRPSRVNDRSASDRLKSLEEDHQIQQDRSVLDVVQVKLKLFDLTFQGVAVAAIDLGPAGQARLDGKAEGIKWHSFFDFFGEVAADGPRTDEAHVAPEDVDQLRQFIQP
jgi:hypothetical protein